MSQAINVNENAIGNLQSSNMLTEHRAQAHESNSELPNAMNSNMELDEQNNELNGFFSHTIINNDGVQEN